MGYGQRTVIKFVRRNRYAVAVVVYMSGMGLVISFLASGKSVVALCLMASVADPLIRYATRTINTPLTVGRSVGLALGGVLIYFANSLR